MTWLWSSWEEYVENVSPQFVTNHAVFRIARRESSFETLQRMHGAVATLMHAVERLHALKFVGIRQVRDSELTNDAKHHVINMLHAGEELLLLNKRLALSEAAYGFLHSNDLIGHWDRYKGTSRLAGEIDQAVHDTHELILGYQSVIKADSEFLVRDLEIPEHLSGDFVVARNLFSLGFDDVGLLIAARGMEVVLRDIAARRKLAISTKGQTQPAAEADLHDLIESMSRIRWTVTKKPLFSPQTRTLLQYLRSVRNAHAHSSHRSEAVRADARTEAALIVRSADRLWRGIACTRARLTPTTVARTW